MRGAGPLVTSRHTHSHPLDQTKTQQRMLSGLSARSPLKQLNRLVRGTDPVHPKPLLQGMSRLYRGCAGRVGDWDAMLISNA